MTNIREFVIDVLKDKLDEYEGNNTYGADLHYDLLQQYNCDGSYTYSTHEAKQWIGENFDELGEIVEDMTEEGLPPVNVFDNPEGFMVCIMLYVAGQVLCECETVENLWNEEFELTEELVTKIKEELDEIK